MDLLSTDATALKVFERKVVRKNFGPVPVADDFRNWFSSERYELPNDINVVQHINIQQQYWLCHVVRIEKDDPERYVFDLEIG